MSYTAEIEIGLPRHEVLQLLMDRTLDVQWRPGLLSCEHICGTPGYPGAETRMLYVHEGGGVRERMEHIVGERLPDWIELAVISPHMNEHQRHSYEKVGDGYTMWRVEASLEFTDAKLAVRRHTFVVQHDCLRAMQSFKSFVERRSAQIVERLRDSSELRFGV